MKLGLAARKDNGLRTDHPFNHWTLY